MTTRPASPATLLLLGKKKSKSSPETEEHTEVGTHGASKATEEVLHTEGDVTLAEPEQQVGGSCEKGAAGCNDTGEFTGNFCIDDVVLHETGVRDFSKYAAVPGTPESALAPDFFLPDDLPQFH